MSGVGGTEAGICRYTVNTTISSRFTGDFKLNIEAMVLDGLDQKLPEREVDSSKWDHLKKLELADPHYNRSQPIDLIIGADYYPAIVINNLVKGRSEDPMAQQTEFGWIVIGNLGKRECQEKITMIATKAIEDQLKLLIENDSIPEERSRTDEENRVESHFQSTVERETDKRYKVRIPFKDEYCQLGESRKKAVARLLQLERKFAKDIAFKQSYHQFMQEYLDLKHMELVLETEEDTKSGSKYYIPHHGITKQDSTTTKLRVVFDASSKTTTGVSLNDIMMTGPKLQEDLADIMLRWRKHKFVMTADIEKMYRQIWINEKDQNYQRILWRTHPTHPIEVYKLKTVTYGTTSASFLAVRALIQLAKEGSQSYPRAANIMLTDFYVDDLLTGCDTIEESIKSLQELQMLTAEGGFTLRKWSSNAAEVLKNIPTTLQSTGNVQIKLNDCIKTLGILYNPKEDTFQFNIEKLELSSSRPTKRSLLAESSKLFDPVGWISPITIATKILMQETWTAGMEWDEWLPEKISRKWIKYKNEMAEIGSIRIPRWANITEKSQKELHGFADASEYAYAAAVYCRSIDSAGHITTHLLTAKTRVAPIKIKLSIPRLELNAALLLAKLMKHVQCAMRLPDCKTFAWTDSTITLHWVKGEPSRFKTFVANRISAIRMIAPTTSWHHVRSQENPADIASRGITPKELVNNHLWWHGPQFLYMMPPIWEASSGWEAESTKEQPHSTLEEKIVLMAVANKTNPFGQLFQKISKYNKLKRIVTYCTQFINNAARNIPTIKKVQTEVIIFKVCQEQDFSNEIQCLKTSKTLNKSSKLLPLNPTLDENGLLRMKGRLQNSSLSTAGKHPIILGKHNLITRRLIEEAHIATLHGGTQLTLAHLRNKFWILGGRCAVRQVVLRCVTCFRHKQHSTEQMMGNLPEARVRPGRPFAKTGIDYAGPIQIRATKGRGYKAYKGYIALFVCMVTKAVHIEIVSSLTTEAFIAAYKRFISRRGLCTDIYSDNGTYFVGANAALKKDYHAAITTLPVEIANMMANDETTWHFIPPLTPHFGGIWEAGIKSVKFHLKRVIGETTLTFEELYTVTTQIEACLNSRPLTPLTNDPADLTALTPGHFLIGDSLKAQPAADRDNMSLRTRWHLVEKMVQDFWKRWSSEYLHQLQQRNKWKSPQPNLMVDDLVIIKDEQQPSTRWKLGRIVETHAGKDELTRVATVKCENTTYKRPIIKLCKLPIEENPEGIISPASSPRDQQQAARQQPSRQAKTKGKINHQLTLAMLSICCMVGLVQANIEITPFNQSMGIYFEELGKLEVVAMKWTLVIHYNMSSYWEEIAAFKNVQTELHAVCKEIPRVNCDVILQQLQWQFNNLMADNDLLLASNKERQRSKRGLGDTVGILLGDTFGILTAREANEYEAHFEDISKNEKHLMALMKNQTTIIDNTIKMVKHNTNLTMTSINNLIKDQQSLKHEMSLLQEYRIYEDRVRSVLTTMIELTLILKSLEDTQQALLDVAYDAHHGILHPAILAPAQLEKELQSIRQHIPATVAIPGHNIHDLLHVYQSMNIRSRVTQRNIIIEIIIPLSFAWDYTLLAVMPVPDIHHDNTQSHIITSTEYLAVDNHREHFAKLTTEQVNRCQTFQPSQFLCEISPIFNTITAKNQCEVAILQRRTDLNTACKIETQNATDHWIKLHSPNQWIYVVPNKTTVDVICGARVSAHNVEGSGIVTLTAGCMLRDLNFYLIAIGTTQSSINKSYQKSLNILNGGKNLREFNSQIKSRTTIYKNPKVITAPDTAKLEKEIETLKENEFLPIESFHHVHHYAMIHLIFWSVILIGVIWIVRCLRQKHAASRRPAPLPRPDTEASI